MRQRLTTSHSVVFRAVICVVGSCILLPGCSSNAPDDQRTVTVQGVAEIDVVPDHVVLTLRVRSLDKDISTSKANSDQALANLVEALQGQGITAEDIETGYVRVTQSFDHTKFGREFEGYEVTRTVIATLRQLDKYSDLLTTCLKSGATHIDGVSFQTSELREHRDAARLKAAGAAREKAEALAEELGASLGAVVKVEEIAGDWNLWYGGSLASNVSMPASGSGVGDDATVTGLVTVRSAVRVSFELK